jgi:predicted RNA-binding Zn-ribbon protein involved in translation (DUF1610 family)
MNKKVLLIDIETAPLMGAVWKLWDNNLSLDMIENDWFIMSYCAKWLGSDKIFYSDCRKTFEDDRQLLVELHALMDEAEFIIAHNGDKFDVKKINARLILNGFTPPSPYKTIDTLKIAKKTFAFTSNKLEYLTGELCQQKKLSHGKFPGYKLWKECLAGNEEAWDEMKEYNIVDVTSLEELYLVLRPWYPNHPLMFTPEDPEDYICPKCGGNHIQKRGKYVSRTGIKYQRYQCQECFGWSKSRYQEKVDKSVRERMPTSL